MSAAQTVRNVMGTIAVFVLFFLSFVIAPDPHLQQTELSCDNEALGVFPNMGACSRESKPGCACFRTKNAWFEVYQWGLVPLVVGMVGYVALRGSLRARLLLLNGATVLGLLAEFVRQLIREPNTLMALPFIPLMAGAFCIAITAVFFVVRFVHMKVAHHAT